MAFKDVLVALTTYPEPTPVLQWMTPSPFQSAGHSNFRRRLRGDIPVPGSVLSYALLNVPAMIGAEAKKSAINAEKLLAAFQDAAEKAGCSRSEYWRQCLTSEVPDVLVDYARLRDLTMVPLPEETKFANGTRSRSSLAPVGRP